MTAITFLPENAVVENHGALRTTSLKVAQAFGKRHDNVLRTLDNLECSQEFNALNFEAVDYIDQKGQFRKAYQMTKDGFMFLVMGFTGKQAAHIKEAYINAFNQMANQLKPVVPVLSLSSNLLTTLSRLPSYYDSGWLPALYRRCESEKHWTYHITFSVRMEGDRFTVLFKYGVAGKNEREPTWSNGGSKSVNSGDYFVYRDLEELWENIRKVLQKYSAQSPF
ncbi:Rha family transcriptional regulator [Vibrio methylphosphonaticus]|uniref:Rha family transcriptional regulator n=1 Tax=Vibrio methylphosphonaticus TaxID=2946866 RepID=UPI00202A0D45|nr:Rha family transcriptional regulator [Vibrio methylphosphonaticus]MCL9775691.1 Rha family transcriptional regulator [Vibrio methylphosphonaticus]